MDSSHMCWLVYGLEENPSNTNRQDRFQMDVKSVISAFSKLESPLIDENSIKDCYCLGKFNSQANKPRPVLVKFLRYTDASNILNNKSKLSKPVFVTVCQARPYFCRKGCKVSTTKGKKVFD